MQRKTMPWIAFFKIVLFVDFAVELYKFFIYWILEDYVHIDEISKTKTILDTRLCIDVLSMSSEEKVKVILKVGFKCVS